MYYDEEYYEAHGITQDFLRLVDKYEMLFPPEPNYEEIELYMEALAEKYSDCNEYY